VTVEKGRPWGAAGEVPPDALLVGSDREASLAVEAARAAGGPLPVLALAGGDLCRTLGGRGDVAPGREAATTAMVDLGLARLDDGPDRCFVAHAVARRSWWRGRVVAAMNAQFLGPWDVAPRAHPGDGRLDVLDGDLSLGDRWKARARLPSGTHVPHPGIRQSRAGEVTLTFARPTPIRLDGDQVGRATTLALRLVPDALTVAV
jgi:hypothetical protein